MSKILLEIGKKVKSRRESLKLSRSQVSEELKLLDKYLDKIENGTLDSELKTSNMVRYLKLYLDYFGMDSQKIISEYKDFFSEKNEKKQELSTNTSKLIFAHANIMNISIFVLLLFIFVSYYIDLKENKIVKMHLSKDVNILLRN